MTYNVFGGTLNLAQSRPVYPGCPGKKAIKDDAVVVPGDTTVYNCLY